MYRLLTRLGRLTGRATALASNGDGSINVLFALAVLPTIGLVGLGVDYGMAISGKTRLDNAADAAALAGVVTAKEYIAANATKSDATAAGLKAGEYQAVKAFNINASKVPFATVSLSQLEIVRNGQTLDATVTYTATVQNTFGRIFGISATTLTNRVNASADLASYLDFYLMVDVSGSMGLPTTKAGMTSLADKNTDLAWDYKQGCQFACHFPDNKGWDLAAGKIQLRSDAVNNAVCALLNRASTPVVPKQYRIGIYPFINRLATLAPLAETDTSLTVLKNAAECNKAWPLAFTNLLDTGATQLFTNNNPTTGTGSGGTHFEKAMPQMKDTIKSYGDGSTASKSKPFVFLITDGMQNGQSFSMNKDTKTFSGNPSKFNGYRFSDWDGSKPKQIDPEDCSALKKEGATISILYIPYIKIDFIDKGGEVARENKLVNSFSPTLAEPLRKCATQGLFFTANTPDDITASLSAMFDQALRVARITQ